MKKVLIIIGSMFLVLLAIIVTGVAYTIYSAIPLDESSKSFALNSLATMAHKWDTSEISPIASPALKKTMETQHDQVKETFRELSSLGELLNAQNIEGGANVEYNIRRLKS